MKAIGVVRRLDPLGRIVLPKETRKEFKIDTGDSVAVYVEDDRIILKKYEPGCTFCGELNNTKEYNGKKICMDCIEKISGKQ